MLSFSKLPRSLIRCGNVFQSNLHTSSILLSGGVDRAHGPPKKLETRHKRFDVSTSRFRLPSAKVISRGPDWSKVTRRTVQPAMKGSDAGYPQRKSPAKTFKPLQPEGKPDQKVEPKVKGPSGRLPRNGTYIPQERHQRDGSPLHPDKVLQKLEFDKQSTPERIAFKDIPETELLPQFLKSVKTIVGDTEEKPCLATTVQSESFAHFAKNPYAPETLIAGQTGSGKTIAYMVPVLQQLWRTDKARKPKTKIHPRCLILSPTKELSIQLAQSAKDITAFARLSVITVTKPSVMTRKKKYQDLGIDIIVGSPRGIADSCAGNYRDSWCPRERRYKQVGSSTGGGVISFDEVEYILVDEADSLLDSKFGEDVDRLLALVRRARKVPSMSLQQTAINEDKMPTGFIRGTCNFSLVFISATIPESMEKLLQSKYPNIKRIASKKLHCLPSKITPEYVRYHSGNKTADILSQIKAIQAPAKVIVFCNKAMTAERMSFAFTEKGMPHICKTSDDEVNKRSAVSLAGLGGFLKPRPKFEYPEEQIRKSMEKVQMSRDIYNEKLPSTEISRVDPATMAVVKSKAKVIKPDPRVLITTSLLSRGMNFDDLVTHVIIAEDGGSEIEFLHRAGRTGRFGQRGRVIVMK